MKDYIVEFNKVTFVYPNSESGIFNINLSIRKGEAVGLIGANGAGKSTLLLHINALLLPNSGKVIVNSLDTSDKNNHLKIRRLVGFVFQDPNDQLFKNRVDEEVAFAPLNMGFSRDEVKHNVRESLKIVGLEGYEKRKPFELSLGEKKRLSIATVLSVNPEILVFDEPTSNLDPHSIELILNLISKLKSEGKTLIVASHNIDFISNIADSCYVLNNGRITLYGPARKVLTMEEELLKNNLKPPLIVSLFKHASYPSPYPLTLNEALKLLKEK